MFRPDSIRGHTFNEPNKTYRKEVAKAAEEARKLQDEKD